MFNMSAALMSHGEDVQAVCPAARLPGRLRRVPLLCGAALMLLGAAVLLGWCLDSQALMTVLPGRVSMKANTAIGFLLTGMALASAAHGSRRAKPLTGCLSVAVICVAGLTLAEYAFGVQLGLDRWLFVDRVETIFPGRMAAVTAVNFLLCSGATLLAGGRARRRQLSRLLALWVGFVSLAAIVATAYGAEIFYGSLGHTAMALHTGLGFLVLALGLLLLDDRSGLMRMLSAQEDGGLLFRCALPGVVLLPLLLGWLYLRPAVNFGHLRLGMALLAVSVACLGAVGLWIACGFLSNAQRQRQQAEKAAQQSHFLEQVNRRLHHRASRDTLTGLTNRGEFEEQLRGSLELARCSGRPLAVLMIDVDDFKRRNDTWGHAAGDRVLVRLGHLFSTTVREPEFVARYGGEEFAALLPGCGLGSARAVAERIRRAVGAEVWDEQPLTLSIGVAALLPAMSDAGALMRAADSALYAAKRTGKDRIVCADEGLADRV